MKTVQDKIMRAKHNKFWIIPLTGNRGYFLCETTPLWKYAGVEMNSTRILHVRPRSGLWVENANSYATSNFNKPTMTTVKHVLKLANRHNRRIEDLPWTTISNSDVERLAAMFWDVC